MSSSKSFKCWFFLMFLSVLQPNKDCYELWNYDSIFHLRYPNKVGITEIYARQSNFWILTSRHIWKLITVGKMLQNQGSQKQNNSGMTEKICNPSRTSPWVNLVIGCNFFISLLSLFSSTKLAFDNMWYKQEQTKWLSCYGYWGFTEMLSKLRLNDMMSVSMGLLLIWSHQTPFYRHGHEKNSARENYVCFGTSRLPLSPGSQTLSNTLCKPDFIQTYNLVTDSTLQLLKEPCFVRHEYHTEFQI